MSSEDEKSGPGFKSCDAGLGQLVEQLVERVKEVGLWSTLSDGVEVKGAISRSGATISRSSAFERAWESPSSPTIILCEGQVLVPDAEEGAHSGSGVSKGKVLGRWSCVELHARGRR